jgi:tetratricopeptide (TPR) repeat protein
LMTLAQMESRFFELKGKLVVGQLTEDEFKREMEKLRFQDSQGRWWMIGAQSGRWYYYDGTRWLLGQPPEPLAPAAPPPPVEPPRASRASAALDQPRTTTESKSPVAPPKTAYVPPPQAPAPTPPPAPRATPPPMVTPPNHGEAQAPREQPVVGIAPRPRDDSTPMPTLADRVRAEMTHAHRPDVHLPPMHVPPVHVPDVHVPDVHAPAPIRRYPPNIILFGAIAVGLLLVAVMWLAVDNFVPGKPISSFLGKTFGAAASATPAARETPLIGASGNVDNFLRVGDEFVAQSQFAPALTQYQTAARSAPNDAAVYVHWARALALTGRIQDAVSTAQRATRLDAHSAEAYAELTRALAWSGQNDAAVSAGEKAIELDAKNATAHAFLAEAYLHAGRMQDAAQEASTAVSLDDHNADAHRAAGWVAVLAGKSDEAVSEWQRVAQLAPDVFFYHFEFGQVYGTYLNDGASAIPEYLKAIQLFPPYVPSYIELGRVYIAQNQPGSAILQYQKALTFDPNSNDAYVGLGLAFQKQGKCPQAIPYFQQSLKLSPTGNEALRGLANCNALAKGQTVPPAPAVPTPGLGAVPTAIVQATVVPLAGATPSAPVASAPAGATTPSAGNGGRIAFSVYDGQFHLYLANTDGTHRQLLTELASDPIFSPDGSQLLYYSWQNDQRGIHRIEADGTADQQISLRFEDFLPSWAPDGTRYVYSTRAGQGADITKRAYRLRIDDPTAKAIQDPPDFVVGQYPAWGPTNKIVFRDCGYPTDTCGLSVINADGSGKTTLIGNMNATAPAWSRDGKLVAFTSDYGGNWDIYIVSANGGSPSRLTVDPAEDGLPTFSPDGKQIAFLSHRGGTWAIWAMGIDGSNQHKLFDLGGDPAGAVPGNSGAQPGQVWYEQRISWQ